MLLLLLIKTNGKISRTDVKNNQEKSKSYLGEIKKGNNKRKLKEQKDVLYDIETLYKARNEAIKFYDDYSLIMSEAKIKATKGKGFKILTPKQMLQRLPIVLAQVKAGNNSESLLNETRKLVYSLHQSKKITKKSIKQHNQIYSMKLHSITYKDGYYIYEFRKQQNI